MFRITAKSLGRGGITLLSNAAGLSMTAITAAIKEIDVNEDKKAAIKKIRPDRNAQFEHISKLTELFQSKRQPVISADAKKRELIGDFKNAGKERRQ